MRTEKVRMDALDCGDSFIGPDGHTEYRVTEPCRDNHNRWLFVYDLGSTLAVDDPDRSGFFSYPPDTLLDRIVSR